MKGLLFAYSVGVAQMLSGANPLYRFEQPFPDAQTAKAVQRFLHQAEARLPNVLKEHVPSISVVFSDMQPKPSFLFSLFSTQPEAEVGPLPLPDCGDEVEPDDAGVEIEGEESEPAPAEKPKKTPVIVYGDFSRATHVIRLNRRFLSDIQSPYQDDRNYRCGHGSMYQLALATLLHETAHAYDFANVRTSKEQEEFAACAKDKSRCAAVKKFQHRRHSVSDHPIFQEIVHEGHTKAIASPDPYERKHPEQEYFPVNFEFFLLQPAEFRMHRPRLYDFFSTYFDHNPMGGGVSVPLPQIGIMTKIPMLDFPTYTAADLAPDKVSRADFFLVASGVAGESRFGHVTLRFKMCKKSLQPDEVCPEEEQAQDLVVTYAADLRNETSINPFKGLMGKYFSATSITYLDTALENYVYLENRQLEAYPLKLTMEQKNNLVLQVLTDFWSFEGNYKFITKNCSTEARDVIKSALGIHGFSTKDPILPANLKARLVAKNLIEEKPVEIYRGSLTLIEEKLTIAMAGDKKKPYATKLIGLPPQRRVAWYKKHMKPDLKALDKLAWQHVEQEVGRTRQVQEIRRLSNTYAEEVRDLMSEIAILREGYGIPTAYRVVMPTKKPLPYRQEMDVFSAGEKAVYTALTL